MRPKRPTTTESSLRRGRAFTELVLCVAAAACTQQSRLEPTLAATTERAATALELVVDPTLKKQSITGFGASSAWTGGSISAATADFLFTADQGIGLSLLRMHIAPDGSTVETPTARLAVARGVKVWAAPWSPPGEWKSNGLDTNGGSLLPDYYQAWADRLTGFVKNQASAGVPLMGLSAQNEPNWTATWESCVYTADQLTVFVRDYLAPAVARDCPGVKLLAPESIDWNTLSSFADPMLADPGAKAAFDIVAVHDYGGTPYAYTAPAANGKELWETEVSYDDKTGILAALETAREIHKHLTAGSVNAFHYWWLVADTKGTGALLVNGEPMPQAFALGHFSKFVRPGYVRLDMLAEPESGVSTSAYADPGSDRIVIVAVNELNSAVDVSLRFNHATPLALEPWLTTTDVSLEPQATVAVTSPFAYTLPPQSITTLVTTDDLPPSNSGEAGQGGQTGIAGATAVDTTGAGGEIDQPKSTGGSGSTTHGSGGTSSARGGSGGKSSSHAGAPATAGVPSEGGAPETSDGGMAGETVRRKPGQYYACLCRVPAGSQGDGSQVTPFIALLGLVAGRRRARRSRGQQFPR